MTAFTHELLTCL